MDKSYLLKTKFFSYPLEKVTGATIEAHGKFNPILEMKNRTI